MISLGYFLNRLEGRVEKAITEYGDIAASSPHPFSYIRVRLSEEILSKKYKRAFFKTKIPEELRRW